MAIRFKKRDKRRRHFIAQWRRYRGLNQVTLAERLDISAATLSRIENSKIPYGQDFLEAVAEALQCEPADLIMRDPTSPDALWTIVDQIPATERPRAIEVLKAFTRAA